ncbi:esterase [bacterium]|nr:esterase [bacterium]
MVAEETPSETAATAAIDHYADFQSKYLRARNVDVWMPANYAEAESFAVLYMHDGQNLFNEETSYGGVSWQVDKTLEKLMQEGVIEPTMVVAIWNTPDRTIEYTPNKPFKALSEAEKNALFEEERITESPKSDAYLKFIVEELKPFIDKNYKTNSDKAHTFIAGSSMGGLISLYALGEYPQVFGGAACVSTHWPLSLKENRQEFSQQFMHYMDEHQASFNNCRLYFDHGTTTLDSMYDVHQRAVDSLFGTFHLSGHNYQSGIFNGAAHNETSWSQRFPKIATFLLGKN